MTTRTEQHQGELTPADLHLVEVLRSRGDAWTTTLEVCRITGCVSARDKIRKLKANGVPIGDAKRLYKSASGANIFGWKLEEVSRRVAA